MRALLAALVLLPLLAGCLDDEGPQDTPATPDLTLGDITVPGGASMEVLASGFAAVWKGVSLPHVVEAVVPEHATMIRAVADSGATSVSMAQAETGRRRCNNPTVEDFTNGFDYPKSCSSATALDVPGAVWRVTFGGTGTGDVRVEFLDAPLDGPLARIDVSRIDPPTRGLQSTIVEFVPSHDGVLLRTERTLPEGSGPFPAVIVSSPYYSHAEGAPPADWTYVVQDWAKRGYAMVTADVRGFADSGGCVEVWGMNEQLDQKFLVDWVAAQPWSDGNVGFYGQSYVGTTPVAAAVHAPEALKAIVTIAPVISAYEDWHYGGVPNGESTGSPAAYQVVTESTVSEVPAGIGDGGFLNDPAQLANNAANGLCDPTLVARANDPRTTYTAFYEERDFKKRAKDVQAAVLYTEGFEDANVKSAMIPGWFNDLQSPKLGLFGHWLHQHPSRLDCEALFLGWFETHLKGKDLGFDALPPALVQVDRETQRSATEWPPSQPEVTSLWPDVASGTLAAEAQGGSADLVLDSTSLVATALGGAGLAAPTELRFTTTLDRDVSLAGSLTLHIEGMLQGAANAYLGAELYAGTAMLTHGQVNLAHNADHTQYTPVVPGETIERDMPFRPTEHLLRAGTEVTLVIRGVAVPEATHPGGLGAVTFMVHSGADATRLDLPGAPLADYEPIALTARP